MKVTNFQSTKSVPMVQTMHQLIMAGTTLSFRNSEQLTHTILRGNYKCHIINNSVKVANRFFSAGGCEVETFVSLWHMSHTILAASNSEDFGDFASSKALLCVCRTWGLPKYHLGNCMWSNWCRQCAWFCCWMCPGVHAQFDVRAWFSD